jgi:hypothetical protein
MPTGPSKTPTITATPGVARESSPLLLAAVALIAGLHLVASAVLQDAAARSGGSPARTGDAAARTDCAADIAPARPPLPFD